VISENREAMISEVNGMLQTSKQIVDNIEYHRNVISACEDILRQLNPDYAKQQERDDAIDSLKQEVGSLKNDMSKILDLLTRAKTD
jgi:predicted DNA binding protein